MGDGLAESKGNQSSKTWIRLDIYPWVGESARRHNGRSGKPPQGDLGQLRRSVQSVSMQSAFLNQLLPVSKFFSLFPRLPVSPEGFRKQGAYPELLSPSINTAPKRIALTQPCTRWRCSGPALPCPVPHAKVF